MSRFRRLGLVLAMVGCRGGVASSDAGAVQAKSTEACSTGPVHQLGDFGQATSTAGSYPLCTPRCGEEGLSMANNIAAVPSGACGIEGDICDMSLGIGCPVGENSYVRGSISGLRCTCSGGNWACAITTPGGGVCPATVDPGLPMKHDPACTTGAAQYSVQNYPPHRDPSSSAAQLPECAARCGATKVKGASFPDEYALADLPSGSCIYEGDHCQISAGMTQTCNGETHACDDSLFECLCQGGSWQCYSTSQGGGLCGPCDQ